jgi:hypothetical protein
MSTITTSQLEGLRDSLELLCQRAEKEGKWLYCGYQCLWFSPAELRKENANGRFLWGPSNFQLRDPTEQLRRLEMDAKEAIRKRDNFAEYLKKNSAV